MLLHIGCDPCSRYRAVKGKAPMPDPRIKLVLRISQMFHLGSARCRRPGDPQADELNQMTESEH
jgi:hypothetical protein